MTVRMPPLQRTIAISVISMLALLGPATDAAVSQEPGFEYGYVVLIPAGDLDGDGSEDAIEHLGLSTDTSEVTRLSGVRGSDGTTLWSMDFDGYVEPYPVENLDGSAGTDVIVLRWSFQPNPAGELATTTLTAVRGEDGEQVWTREYTGFATWVGVGSSGGSVQLGHAYPRRVAEDMNGDGAGDLLISRSASGYLYEGGTGTFRESANAIFEVVSGRTGELISAIPVVGIQGYPDADVIPDVTGDGLADVLTMSVSFDPAAAPSQGGTASLSAYPGTGGLPVWQTQVEVLSPPYLQTADLDGDGGGDALLVSNSFDESGATSSRFDAISGNDGSSMWQLEFDGYADAIVAGDATDDAGQDLLAFVGLGGSEGEEPGALLVRGSDGETVWARSSPDIASSYPASDATGDGVLDLLSTGPRSTRPAPEPLVDAPGGGEARTAKAKLETPSGGRRNLVRIFDGANGKRVWTRVVDRRAYVLTIGGDLDGDGADDLAVIQQRRASVSYFPISGKTGRGLWGRAISVKGYINQISAATLRGGPRGDVLESGSGSKGELLFAAARSGSSGARLWERTVKLTPDEAISPSEAGGRRSARH
ncbi:MAG: FG-GAP repeat domain-containing protein [Actinomycetota bacterium]